MIGNHRDAWVYARSTPAAARRRPWKPVVPSARRCVPVGSLAGRSCTRAGMPRNTASSAPPNGPRACAEEIDTKTVFMLERRFGRRRHGTRSRRRAVVARLLLETCGGGHRRALRRRTLRTLWTEKKRWAPLARRTPPSGMGSGCRSSRPGIGRLLPDALPRLRLRLHRVLDHLGIPTVDGGLKGGYGVYHSIYDDFNWMEKFGDPEFFNHATAAKLYTLIAMRAAAADVAPLRFVPYGLACATHVDELRAHSCPTHPSGRSLVRRAAEGDRRDFGDLIHAVLAFQDRAEAFDRASQALTRRDTVDPTTWPRSTTPS